MTFLRRRAVPLLVSAVILVAAAVGLVLGKGGAEIRILHTEPSTFAPVVVFEQYGERCMNFVEAESGGRQTCMQLDEPQKLVFEYTRLMASALLVRPAPESVLVIGLGGATLPVALHRVLPDAVIDSVEIDPAVVRVAERFFGYETGPRQRVYVEDGRAFVERALAEGRRYDMVMLDAFDVDYIPAHLLTREFLQAVHDILSPNGLLVANSFTQSSLYERETATYTAVFGAFYNLRAHLEGNRVIIASPSELPGTDVLRTNALALESRLKPLGIDAQAAVMKFVMTRERYDEEDVLHDAAQSNLKPQP